MWLTPSSLISKLSVCPDSLQGCLSQGCTAAVMCNHAGDIVIAVYQRREMSLHEGGSWVTLRVGDAEPWALRPQDLKHCQDSQLWVFTCAEIAERLVTVTAFASAL